MELRQYTDKPRHQKCAYQCLDCGVQCGQFVAVGELFLSQIPIWNYQLVTLRNRQREQRREREQQEKDAAWHARHHAHVTSDKWRLDICPQVMRRCDGWCEGCGTRRATQVHHKTYEHLGDEFLFELLALCERCHERLHRKGLYAVSQPQQQQERPRPRLLEIARKVADKPDFVGPDVEYDDEDTPF